MDRSVGSVLRSFDVWTRLGPWVLIAASILPASALSSSEDQVRAGLSERVLPCQSFFLTCLTVADSRGYTVCRTGVRSYRAAASSRPRSRAV